MQVIFTPLAERQLGQSPRVHQGPKRREPRRRQCRPDRRNFVRGWTPFRFAAPKRDDLLAGLRTVGFERRVTIAFIVTADTVLIDEEKQHLTRSMFVSLFPNWIGQTQPRIVKSESDMLHLSTASPIRSGGKTVNSRLTWRRAEPNWGLDGRWRSANCGDRNPIRCAPSSGFVELHFMER